MKKLFLIIFPCVLFLFSKTVLADGSLFNITVTPESERLNAPGFMIEKLGGGKAGLSDYKGKVVLLNFWATWCMPCRQEMPSMETLWQKYKAQGFVIVAISNDEGSPSRIESFSKIFKLGFPILLDPEGKVSGIYKVSGLPTSYLIDRKGKIVSYIVGSKDWASPAAFKVVEKLLSQ